MAQPLLKKRLGQHHLTRSELCRPLVEFLAPQDHPVIEVGPGGGILTDLLLEESSKVVALELDPEWAFTLLNRSGARRPVLVIADAMQLCWERVPAGSLVAGNLPYEIATALIRKLLPLHERIPRLGFLFQREVADRLVAKPGDKAYGLLSVLASAWSEPRLLAKVARGSFRPPPKVDGAFVGFSLKAGPLPNGEMAAFVRTVELSFSQRRKTLRNALASGWGREGTERVLATAGIDDRLRAEEIGLDAFLRIERARRNCLS